MFRRKIIMCFAALFLCLAANLNIGWELSLNGRALEGRYSSECIRRSSMAARLAAEEILERRALMPQLQRRLSLSFRPPTEDSSELSHQLLSAVPGLSLSDFVSVNGVTLGCVESGEVLMEKLRGFIHNQMPNAASYGSFSGDISVLPRYTRAGGETPYGDMVLLVSGMAPVMYVDSEGRPA